MNDQMTFTTEEGEKIILAEEVEKKEKAAAEYLKARSRARAVIKDAKLRYIKEKTRARSKKAAEEREQIRNHTDDGIYSDLVTKALDRADSAVFELWQEEIDDGEYIRKEFNKQQKKAEEEAEAWMKRQEESMRRATE